MIEEMLKDIKDLRDEMLSVNWPAQRLSNIILKYEMKLQDKKSQFTNEEIVEATNKILNDK
jgi:DNA-binding transcriptional regulator PaaX